MLCRKERTKSVPNYCELKPAILSAETIARDLVYPTAALIGVVFVVSLHIRDIDVHSVIRASKLWIVFRGTVFKFPQIIGDVMSWDGHVECAVYE
jgi:hypothetical protein